MRSTERTRRAADRRASPPARGGPRRPPGVALIAALALLPWPAGPAAGQTSARQPRTAPSAVPEPPPTSAREVRAFTDSLARATLEESPAAGMSVAVVRGGDTLVHAGWGRADLELDVPATAGTVYRIGSLTKQFTAAAVLRQVEEGRLALDDTLGAFLPGFEAGGRRVTVRQLLGHTSGLKNYTGLEAFWEKSRLDLTHRELLSLLGEDPFEFEPGTRYAYSNTGYYVLGMILEEVTGRDYGAWMREELFRPLGLDDTRYCRGRSVIERRAEGYRATDDGELVNDEPLSMTAPFAAGALCSTVGDLVAWTRALHGGRVVSASSLDAMTTPGTLPDGTDTGYGFGLSVGSLEGHPRIAHAGGINGFSSRLAHYPADDLTVAVLVNTRGAGAEQVEDRIARKALGLPQPAVTDLPLSEAEARRYTGKYMVRQAGLPVQVVWEDGQLKAQPAGQPAFDLHHQGEHEFRASFDPNVRLVFRVEGAEAESFVLHQGGMAMEAVRVTREKAPPAPARDSADGGAG